MQFGHACVSHIKSRLSGSPELQGQSMDFSIVPLYGKAGRVRRTGVTVHTEPASIHDAVVGYRMKVGFGSPEARAAASRGVDEVHDVIKSLFSLGNDAAWVLRDKNSNEVWFTFTCQEKNPEQFFSDVIAKSDMRDAFTKTTKAIS